MQGRFVELPELRVVGLGVRFISIMSEKKNNFQTIPALWHDFIQRVGEIGNREGMNSLGLVEQVPEKERSHPAEMFYIACGRVKNFDGVPAGMITRTIPAGAYVSFTHKGKLEGLEGTMTHVFKTWLPASGKKLRNGPQIEWYDERFKLGSEESEFDILLPIAEK